MRKFVLGLGLFVIALALSALVGCATLLPRVSSGPVPAPQAAPVLGAFGADAPVETAAEWTVRRAPLLQSAFADHVFGPLPEQPPPRVLSRTTFKTGDGVRLERLQIAVTAGDDPIRFNLALATPPGAGPHPFIIAQVFCGVQAALEGRPKAAAPPRTTAFSACNAGWADPMVKTVFGRDINGPPLKLLLSRGYAAAIYYAGDVVADHANEAPPMAKALAGENGAAIAAWAWSYSRALDVLAADPRLDPKRIAVWGHSRNGKAALLAGATDPRIAAVIAHQSGRGGASLSRGGDGETIAAMMKAYPFWFPAFYTHFESQAPKELDQHHLLAMIAPRPFFLGDAWRDAHADPRGAFAAAQAASPAWRLFGKTGLDQEDMCSFNPRADIAYFIRPGLHGVHRKDWNAFLAFLDAHFAPTAP
jgi:dienelactone hydrolase